VDASQFDLIVIPGGWAPDRMRRSTAMVGLVRQAHEQRRLIAAIGHAGSMLCSANVVRGRRVTSAKSIKDDMVNAGATWVDEGVVRDGNLITARKQSDLPAFLRAVVEALQEAWLLATNGAR